MGGARARSAERDRFAIRGESSSRIGPAVERRGAGVANATKGERSGVGIGRGKPWTTGAYPSAGRRTRSQRVAAPVCDGQQGIVAHSTLAQTATTRPFRTHTASATPGRSDAKRASAQKRRTKRPEDGRVTLDLPNGSSADSVPAPQWGMTLSQATWPEVEALDRETTVLVPTAATVQHGPHLPLGTAVRVLDAVAGAVEGRTPVLLLPTVWLGFAPGHAAFAGSLDAGFPAYAAALEATFASLTRHGFRRFYLLNGHAGNAGANDVALRGLKAAQPNLALGGASLDAFAGDARPLGARHADEATTSLMLHLDPESVRAELPHDEGLAPEPAVRGLVEPFDVLTERGAYGDPGRATAAAGAALFEALVAGVVEELEAFRSYVLRGGGAA